LIKAVPFGDLEMTAADVVDTLIKAVPFGDLEMTAA
jgi:hypothetical protein